MKKVLKHFLRPLRRCYRADRHTCSSFRDRNLINLRDRHHPFPDCTYPCPCLHPFPYHHTYRLHHTFLLHHTYCHYLRTFLRPHSHHHSLHHKLIDHNYYFKLMMQVQLIHHFILCHQLILSQFFLLQVSVYLLMYSVT